MNEAMLLDLLRQLYKAADALDTCLVNCDYLGGCEHCESARAKLADVLAGIKFVLPDIET